jgi:hypothetical protein
VSSLAGETNIAIAGPPFNDVTEPTLLVDDDWVIVNDGAAGGATVAATNDDDADGLAGDDIDAKGARTPNRARFCGGDVGADEVVEEFNDEVEVLVKDEECSDGSPLADNTSLSVAYGCKCASMAILTASDDGDAVIVEGRDDSDDVCIPPLVVRSGLTIGSLSNAACDGEPFAEVEPLVLVDGNGDAINGGNEVRPPPRSNGGGRDADSAANGGKGPTGL